MNAFPKVQQYLPKRIVVLGSSSVYGTGDTEGGFVERLRRWAESLDSNNLIYNLGVWGDTTKSMIARIDSECPPRKPQLIVLYPGLNDIRRVGSHSASNYVPLAEYDSLITKMIKAAAAQTEVLMMSAIPFDQTRTTPYARSDWFYLREDAQRYTAVLEEKCAQEKIGFIDIHTQWSKQNDFSYLSDDGLHASPNGHQRLFQELQRWLISSTT